jgi:8-amino-7-oxononanoate synthase
MTEQARYAVSRRLAEVARLIAEHPMGDAVVDETDGRMLKIGDHWLGDFASCNYLGLDLDPEVLAGIPDYLARWGTHPSWARGIASPALYEQVEAEVADLLGVEDALAFPTLTHIHNGVLPALAGEGTLPIDARAHQTIHDAAVVAGAHHASVHRLRPGDLRHAERLLRRGRRRRRG